MNKLVAVFFLSFFAFYSALAQDTPVDSEEVFQLVERTAVNLETRLNDAVSLPEVSNLLIKLMESYEDFNTIALMGLYCQGARVAAELGRNQCNWVNFVKEKDVTSLLLRAQEARLQAFKMRDAVAACRFLNQQLASEKTLSIADIMRSNAEQIKDELTDGLASKDMHILAQKIEHAERVFHQNDMLASKCSSCTALVTASKAGWQACADALAAKDWPEAEVLVQKALSFSTVIREKASGCFYAE
jgi:hypothetical protein